MAGFDYTGGCTVVVVGLIWLLTLGWVDNCKLQRLWTNVTILMLVLLLTGSGTTLTAICPDDGSIEAVIHKMKSMPLSAS
ncbi:MAG: hypothetical protein H6572_02255 [Lewinellaceae bacterium]|nr:hypothetical protein [Lewinellaceae bacterium]